MIKTVAATKQFGLCSSCGLCKNICAKGAITYDRKNGMYYPTVDHDSCIECGMCVSVCPGLGAAYAEGKNTIENVFGNCKYSYNAWSKDPLIRHTSASGGVVSTLVSSLLQQGIYDVAFCVDSYDYNEQLKTRMVSSNNIEIGIANTSLPKSRYLAVSHEKLVAFLKNNREKRVIVIGTSCAIRGIRKVMKLWHLEDSRYLLIGLFCDKVFNYNVVQYFEKQFGGGKELIGLHFKNKESGGWPGNMKLIYRDGTSEYCSKEDRCKAKDYFMPERCLYCVDKLNVQSDISLGDNYTGQDSSPLGSNTVLIRTEKGERAWESVKDCLVFHAVNQEKVRQAQYLDGRLNNRYYAALKEERIQKRFGVRVYLNQGLTLEESKWDYAWAYDRALRKLSAGEEYIENPEKIKHQTNKEKMYQNGKNPVVLAEKVYYVLKRIVKNRRTKYKRG